jgi:hypothetical protein
MEKADLDYASQKLIQFNSEFQIKIIPDWQDAPDGSWQKGKWAKDELDRLYDFICILSNVMGGNAKFIKCIGGAEIKKENIGSHGGEALSHLVRLSERGGFDAWTIVHEFAHAWDANNGWQLSVALERYTGGFTSLPLAFLKRLSGKRDSALWKAEEAPGRRGRLPGCNAAGYFYANKPSGSSWAFNRKEDFAESVAMYVGWNRHNALSAHAHARVERYLLPNRAADSFFRQIDNWADYAPYFYPKDGDYAKTQRWLFVDGLVNGTITLT